MILDLSLKNKQNGTYQLLKLRRDKTENVGRSQIVKSTVLCHVNHSNILRRGAVFQRIF